MKKLTPSLLILLTIMANIVLAQDGTLDPTFGSYGVANTIYQGKNARGQCMATLSDGNIIIGVNSDVSQWGALIDRGFSIIKLLPSGQIDPGFGTNGTLDFPNSNNGLNFVFSMVKQPDDRILVSCKINGTDQILRITPDGLLDTGFGMGGAITASGHVGLQADGKIIVGGQYYDGFNNFYSFSRFHSNGTIDTSFGSNGSAQIDITSFRFDICQAIAIQPDNKIVAAGTSYDNASLRHAVLVRFTENGLLDASFGNNGIALTSSGPAHNVASFEDIELTPDGKITAAGNKNYSGGTGGFGGVKPAIVRYKPDGLPDLDFGTNGTLILDTQFNANDMLNAVKLQPDGKILIGGTSGSPFPIMQSYFYLARLQPDGNIDATFGNNGFFLTEFSGSETNTVHEIALQPDGRILAIGLAKDSANQNFIAVVCRFNNTVLSAADYAESAVVIFPNPAQAGIVIIAPDLITEITIYNSLGQLVRSFRQGKTSREVNLDLSGFQEGIYFVSLNLNGKQLVSKIVKN